MQIVKYLKQSLGQKNSKLKVNTPCRKINSDTIIPNGFGSFHNVVLPILRVLHLRLLLKTNINRKKYSHSTCNINVTLSPMGDFLPYTVCNVTNLMIKH